jgi:hypothetical protein
MRRVLTTLVVALLGLLLPMQTMAASHGGDIYLPLSERIGVEIPEILHGQKAVFDAHRAEVLALAAEVAPDDATVRELSSYVADQYRAAWFGLMPGAMESDASPFHLPTHGYLAGTRALMLHLEKPEILALMAKTDQERVKALGKEISADLMAAGTMSMEVCAESATAFNTTQPVAPNWDLAYQDTATKVVIMLLIAAGIALAAFVAGVLTLLLKAAERRWFRPTLA